MADGESNLDIPEGYIPWLLESDEKDEEGNPIKKLVVDEEGKVVLCDECPCLNKCWWLYESTCEIEEDRDTGERTVIWSEPELIAVDCMPTPEIANEWYWVRYATVWQYVTNDIRCKETQNLCEEFTPPSVEKPTFEDCCEFRPISGGPQELPYKWETIFDGFEEDPETGDLYPVYRNIKVYRDLTEEDNVILGIAGSGDCEWSEWSVEFKNFQGTLHARILFPCEDAKPRILTLGSARGEALTAVINLCPTWSAELFVTTDYAHEYNLDWEDPEGAHDAARWWALGLVKSQRCAKYCFLEFFTQCLSPQGLDLPWCKENTAPIVVGPFSSDFNPPFPYNRGGWLVPDPDNPDGPWIPPIRDGDQPSQEATLVQLMCASTHFPDWLKNNCTTEITCQDWETPMQCEEPDPDDGCPIWANLTCRCCNDPYFHGFETNMRYRTCVGFDHDTCTSVYGGYTAVVDEEDPCYCIITASDTDYADRWPVGNRYHCSAVVTAMGGEPITDTLYAWDGCGPTHSIGTRLSGAVTEIDWDEWDATH